MFLCRKPAPILIRRWRIIADVPRRYGSRSPHLGKARNRGPPRSRTPGRPAAYFLRYGPQDMADKVIPFPTAPRAPILTRRWRTIVDVQGTLYALDVAASYSRTAKLNVWLEREAPGDRQYLSIRVHDRKLRRRGTGATAAEAGTVARLQAAGRTSAHGRKPMSVTGFSSHLVGRRLIGTARGTAPPERRWRRP